MPETLEFDFEQMRRASGGFPAEAFQFVRDGLGHTVRVCHGDLGPDESRHVDGRDLCFGLKDYAIKRYGLLARTVLRRWGITRTEDFGRIVFAMVEAGLMRKTEEDSLQDFTQVYDFDEAFDDGLERV